ncbi:hypothetical protein F383_38330 [Gossypium arboreum]|uniref:Uncharacterized protein n=1 Tax=Gossypium arboreum TaxID=29729 RepID=A0A0B0MF07_GOSAR|nr:hypothetical protein F383_38330 [Gossypium arboreum]
MWLHVRPPSRTLVLYDICVIIRVTYPISNGSTGIDQL